ncbi:MAG: DUF2470 domain-containing protein [Myxococcota bacterium]
MDQPEQESRPSPDSRTVAPEIEAAAQAALAGAPDARARGWLRETLSGTLCTLAARRGLEGHPFGSVVPYALDAQGRPFVLLARIAAHTANLSRDARASLLVQEPGLEGDPQRGWRITVMGHMAPVPEAEVEGLHPRYRARVPAADRYLGTHDFGYWRMEEVTQVRYIAGFGEICWLPGTSVLVDPDALASAAPGAIAHMNEDHAHNLVEMCAGLHGIQPARAEMIALDGTGFAVRTTAPDHHLWFAFDRDVDGSNLRQAVVGVLARARRRG